MSTGKEVSDGRNALTQQGCQHIEVYRQPGQFAGWPANYGLWMWGDEAVVVFAQDLLGSQGNIHARDRRHQFRPRQPVASTEGSLGLSRSLTEKRPAAHPCQQTSML